MKRLCRVYSTEVQPAGLTDQAGRLGTGYEAPRSHRHNDLPRPLRSDRRRRRLRRPRRGVAADRAEEGPDLGRQVRHRLAGDLRRALVDPDSLRKAREPGKGPVIERGTYRIGLEWRSPAGTGQLLVPSEIDPNGAYTIELDYAWSPRTDWSALFDRLVEITQPAYAMLHLFTERELESYPAGEGLDRFEGPVAGEGSFTGWLSSLGDWRSPDRHRLKERRQYRFLPQLSWANVLGREFEGRYDPQAIDRLALAVRHADGRTAFRVSEALRDVERDPDAFEAARARLREAFAPDVFRR